MGKIPVCDDACRIYLDTPMQFLVRVLRTLGYNTFLLESKRELLWKLQVEPRGPMRATFRSPQDLPRIGMGPPYPKVKIDTISTHARKLQSTARAADMCVYICMCPCVRYVFINIYTCIPVLLSYILYNLEKHEHLVFQV